MSRYNVKQLVFFNVKGNSKVSQPLNDLIWRKLHYETFLTAGICENVSSHSWRVAGHEGMLQGVGLLQARGKSGEINIAEITVAPVIIAEQLPARFICRGGDAADFQEGWVETNKTSKMMGTWEEQAVCVVLDPTIAGHSRGTAAVQKGIWFVQVPNVWNVVCAGTKSTDV